MQAVIAIANQKGGVGKTTSAAALGVCLSRAGQRTHVIDMDPQANLTSSLGYRGPGGELYEALRDETALPVLPLDEHLSLTPSSATLSRGESEFLAEPAVSQFLLQTSLGKTDLPDDAIVIIDCPPSLGVLGINALAAAHYLIVAVHPGRFELDGLKRLHMTADRLKQKINPELRTAGVIVTNADLRKKITMLVLERLSSVYPALGLIRRDAQLQYACGDGTIRFLNDRQSHAMGEYVEVAEKLRELVWEKETTGI